MKEYQEINEINLIDLMFYCLKRWRLIVVCMFFLAVVAGIFKYQTTIIENQLKREEQLKHTITDQVEEEMQSDPIIFEDPISSAASFAIIGLLSGACLICLIFCMSYIMSEKLQNEKNFQEKFNMPLLGVIRNNEAKRRLLGFVDHWICRLEEGPYATVLRKEQIKIAAVNVQAAIHKIPGEKIKKVMFVGTVEDEDVIEICDQLAEEIEDIVFSSYQQIVFHAAALKKLECYEGVLFIEKQGKSYEELIRQERRLADDRNVKVLGAIIC